MIIKQSENIANREVISKINTINLYTPNDNTLSKIVFTRIKNPNLAGSAYWFDSGIEVGQDSNLGFTTGGYIYVDNVKYVEIELTLPAILASKYNHPETTINKTLVKYINRRFKGMKKYKGCTLLYQVPTTCFIKEQNLFFIDFEGNVKSYVDEYSTDQDTTITDTSNSTYNDGSENIEETKIDNTTLLSFGLLLLKFLK